MTGPFLLSISVFIPPCGMVGILSLLRVSCTVKTKFHYAVQLASRSQTSSRPNPITLSSLWPAREQVCDQLASWFATC